MSANLTSARPPLWRIARCHLSLRTVWLGLALAMLGLSAAGFFPAISLATRLSDDHALTAAYTAFLQRAQWSLSILALVLWPLTIFRTAPKRILRFLLYEMSDTIFLPAIALFTFCATLLVQTFLFQGIPHVTDATSHLFQAKILALGQLWAQAPACPDHFFQPNVIITSNGRWFAAYPPGHALTLWVAARFRCLPLYGPTCTALILLACTRIVRHFYGRTFARAFALLFALSPMLHLVGGSFMSHLSLLCCASLALAFGLEGLDRMARPGQAAALFVGSGFLLGMSILIRPQDVALLAPPILIGVVLGFRAIASAWRIAAPAMLAGLVIPISIQLFWNYRIFDSAWALGYGRTDVGSLSRVYMPSFGLSDSFTLQAAIQQFLWLILRFDSALLGWPTCLPFIGLAFLRRRPDRRDLLCLGAFVLVAAFYFTYAYYGREYEARYYFALAPCMVVLVLRGLYRLRAWRPIRAAVPLLTLLLILHAGAHYWPAYVVPHYRENYEETSPVADRLARQSQLSRAVVLIGGPGSPQLNYSSGFIYNDPQLAADVIYARDLPEKNHCLFAAFPDRTIYRLWLHDDWTHGTFEQLKQD
jgi:hypothetical protein